MDAFIHFYNVVLRLTLICFWFISFVSSRGQFQGMCCCFSIFVSDGSWFPTYANITELDP